MAEATQPAGERDRALAVERAVAVLDAGRLVAFPTETVYGLGADAASAEAVERIFVAKGRPRTHPLIVHVADAAGPERLGSDLGPAGRRLAQAFWPGPLTVVVNRGDGVDPAATGGRDTVGLRVPDHPLTLALLQAFGRGVAGPSANRFGSVSPTTAAHVVDDLGPLVDVVLDGGPCRVGVESTIVDLTGPDPALLRPGGISAVEIEAVLGHRLVDGRAGPPRASGMLDSHYAPDVSVELVTADDLDRAVATAVSVAGTAVDADGRTSGPRIGVIAPGEVTHRPAWALPGDAAGYAAGLYATLREADRAALDHLLIVPPDHGDLLDAVLDRLVKAAAPRTGATA